MEEGLRTRDAEDQGLLIALGEVSPAALVAKMAKNGLRRQAASVKAISSTCAHCRRNRRDSTDLDDNEPFPNHLATVLFCRRWLPDLCRVSPRMKDAWRSGIVFTAINLLTLLIGFGFNIVVRHELQGQTGEFGSFQAALAFVGFLGLPLGIATYAITHYIARFHFSSDGKRLEGLLAAVIRFAFGTSAVRFSPLAEWAVL
ncbi:MAG: hypothetical protein P4M10_07705, partial [Verrucomicrobiae bacterium]|nr:hypothetical protein [Verrucomicrobiae bacterium]